MIKEKEKMLAGDLYNPSDPELAKDKLDLWNSCLMQNVANFIL
ncbi:maltose acetyltransferase domain-containing protein [Bacillus spizizenii]|nr:maltose acetyltransferase domain-containing protein [Bacillus spizizenii]